MAESLDVRALSGAMAKILLVFLAEPGGLTLEELSRLSGVRDPKTVRLACRDLAADGLLSARKGAHGKETWLAERLLLPDNRQALKGENPHCKKEAAPGRGKSPARAGKPRQNGDNPPGAESLVKSEESTQSETLENTDRAQGNRELLENAYLLFGKTVAWDASFARKDAREVLAWLAQAWEAWREAKVDRPWGLVYRGLQGKLRQKLPDKQFRADPAGHLPENYLEACGLLPAAACAECGGQFGRRAELEAHLERAHPPAAEPPAGEPEAGQPEAPGARAWRAVLAQLENQIPRGVFECRVRATRAAEWDEGAGLLTVSAENGPAVEWLESRLTTTVERMLCGVLNNPVKVKFVAEGGSHAGG